MKTRPVPDRAHGGEPASEAPAAPGLALKNHAAAFRDWAASLPLSARSAEWECEYEHWPEIWASVQTFAAAPGTDRPAADLLFLLARDNETETIAEILTAHPALLIWLAKEGRDLAEPSARWQLANALGNIPNRDAAIVPLLTGYCHDTDEYVRRRALLALGRHRAPDVEPLADRDWAGGSLYARLAALQVLADLASPLFWRCHAEAVAGDDPMLAAAAERLAAACRAIG